jgi:hypothetical protein
MAKTVGSNYFLENRLLRPEYKSPGWQVLAAGGGTDCAEEISILLRG